jgi:hypothetical protein
MKLLNTVVSGIAVVFCLTALESSATAQAARPYQQMSGSERAIYVSAKAKVIGRRISDSDYQFTASFETKIQTALDSYVQPLDNKRPGATSPGVIIARGQSQAATLMTTFKARGVSPLIGLYLPWIESEYVNLSSPNESGAIGMFQFLPQTGMVLGLTPEELLDVEKATDAAARYIASSMKTFDQDRMKEALAVLAYNRGDRNVKNDIALLANEKNSGCSICLLTEQRDKLNKTFKPENVYYVPRFFAAAILGENPQDFGLTSPPLSSFGTGH